MKAAFLTGNTVETGAYIMPTECCFMKAILKTGAIAEWELSMKKPERSSMRGLS